MIWIINGKKCSDIDMAVEAICGEIDSTEFDAWIDATQLPLNVCDYQIAPSQALKLCEPAGYEIACHSWLTSLCVEISKKLADMDCEYDTFIYGVYVESTYIETDGEGGKDEEETV